MFPTLGSKVGLADRVVQEIQTLIIEGQLEPGMKLPPERDLAEQIGVSRTVIREAVRILVTKGLLETKPGIGTIVREVTSDQISESLNLLLKTKNVSIEHLHQVRSILEVEIAGLAADQATQEEIAILQQIMIEMEQVKNEPTKFVGKDNDFHRGLAQTTHNPLLILLLDSIRDLMQEVRLRVYQHPDIFDNVIPDHYKILEQVSAKNSTGARQAMQEHLDHAQMLQRAMLGQ